MTTLATDDFNRADNNSLGASWTQKRANTGITSNAAAVKVSPDDTVAYYSGTAWPNDQWSQGTALLAGAAGRITGAGVRLTVAADRSGYYGGYENNNDDNTRRIWKWVGATYTSLATDGVAISANDVLYLEIQGTSLVLKINGTTRVSTTDASHASGNAGFTVGNTATDVSQFDAWTGGDFASATYVPDSIHRQINTVVSVQ